jgi:phospho-2-dehydro-3-deoxyheptonate aldolase
MPTARPSAILEGRDEPLLVIVGPCSIHDPRSALEYADRLAALAAKSATSCCW